MNKLVVAIVGFGKSATRYHLPYLLARKNIGVKYIVDPNNLASLHEKYEDYGIKFVETVEDAMSDDEVQLLTLCTPPSTHYDLAKRALLSGKNVLVEKPFCENTEQAKELFELANDKGLTVMPYQNRRFDSDFLTLSEVLKRGYVGQPLAISSRMDKYRPNNTKQDGSVQNGALYSMGVHPIDQAVSLFGKPVSVTYDLQHVQNIDSTIDDAFKLCLNYDLLRYEIVINPLVSIPYPRFVLQGKSGMFIKASGDQQENDLKLNIFPNEIYFGQDQPREFGNVRYCNSSGDWIEKDIPTISGDYGRVYDSLVQTINHGGPRLVSEEETLTVLEILEKGSLTEGPQTIYL